MAVTIKEIAEYAGVSRGTVDRALNNRAGINPDVAKRIKKIAAELGYKPNRAGKALASRKNPIHIAIILNSEGNSFYKDVIKGINTAVREYQDFSLQADLIQLKGYRAEDQLKAIQDCLDQNANALIITPMNEPAVREKLLQLNSKGIPVIKLNSDLENTGDSVYIGCNYLKSGAAAAGLLGMFSGGTATVGIITGSEKMLGHHQRMEGFIRTCEEDFPEMKIASFAENNDDDDTSYEVTRKMLEDYPLSAVYFTAGGVSGGVRAIEDWLRADPARKKPFVLCCDATEEIRALMLDDRIDATVCQQPFQQGYSAIRTVFEIVMSGSAPRHKEIYMDNEIKIKYNLK